MCGNDRCDRILVHSDSRTCELTSFSFSVDNVVCKDADQFYDSRRTERVKLAHQNATNTPAKRNKRAYRDVVDIHAREMEALKIINAVFPDDSLVNKGQILAVCVRLWVLMWGTNVHRGAEHRYRFAYHCLVVIRHHAFGFKAKGRWIIPRCKQVFQNLPSFKEVQFSDFSFNTRWLTSSLKVFRMGQLEQYG